MKNLTEDKKQPMQPLNPRTYHTPRLSMYGAVRELTSAGGSATGETGKGAGQKSKP